MLLFNSLTNTKQLFKSFNEKKVKMYVCGITPYDTTHLGHAFTYVFYDILQRFLKYQGFEVEYTQNVTDIDDDILKRAKKVNQDWQELGKFWTDRFLDDLDSLNVLFPNHFVRATGAIDKIIEITKDLIYKNIAYEKNGNVYFSVEKYKKYGQLSLLSQKEMISISSERGANPNDPNKKNPLDFILWQKSLPDEPSWPSPWSDGRPGWHIECSAMIHETLGNQIDIHGGGYDLIYPHHESEIAQSQSYTNKIPFVKYWLHTAMVYYQGEKMSKSLGNLILVSDLLKTYSPVQIRFLLLSHHYRETWEYKESDFKEVIKKVSLLEKALAIKNNEEETTNQQKIDKLKNNFIKTLQDDMNTPKTLEILTKISQNILKETDSYSLQLLLKELTLVLGFNFK